MRHQRAEEFLAELTDNSVDLILTDPPYYRVKNEPWDRQWDKPQAFLEWIDSLCIQWARVLRPNGSLYCFASPQMAARVEVTIAGRFNVVNRITWAKPRFSTKAEMFRKEDLRGFFPSSEAIIFAEHHGADTIAKGEAGYQAKCDDLRGFVFEPLRAYLDGERIAAGITPEDANEICGHRREGGMAGRHYFSTSQWCLPTAQNYAKLQAATGRFSRLYEDLRREYESLRRPFEVSAEVPYTDVWTFPTVSHYPGKHSCEKPQEMLRHIITASSRPGAVVLDCFAGSGSTGVAALELGRSFLGCDFSEHWANYARNRLERVQASPEKAEMKTVHTEQRRTAKPEQMRFFDANSTPEVD